MMMTALSQPLLCPCGTGNSYADCCGVFISGKQHAPSPETLMRSRYSAFTLANIPYLVQTMEGPAAKNFDPLSALQWAKQSLWQGLTVVNSWLDPKHPDRGFVEFIARFHHQQQDQQIHEISEFQRKKGRWYYVDGKSPTPRNPR